MTQAINGFGYNTQIAVDHEFPVDLGTVTTQKKRELLKLLANALSGKSKRNFPRVSVFANSANYGQHACAVAVAGATTTGTVGATINGVGVTVAAVDDEDVNTCAALATAINASTDALVQYIVKATSYEGKITLASVLAGSTVFICGYKLTAVAVTPTRVGEFLMTGNNTADAAALVVAINKMPGLNELVIARSTTDAVTLSYLPNAAGGTISSSYSTFTIVAFAQVAFCCIYAVKPGISGNCITIAGSGTGITIFGSLSRLAGGVGGSAVNRGTIVG